MKIQRFYVGLGAFAAVVAVIALANQAGIRNAIAQELEQPAVETEQQDQLRTGQELDLEHEAEATQAIRASDLIGMNVRARDEEDRNVGSINDLMLTHDGEVLYVAVSFGGFLGIGDKLFAVPMDAIEIVEEEEGVLLDRSYARIDVTEERLRAMEGFDRADWPQQADHRFHGEERHVERPTADPDVTR